MTDFFKNTLKKRLKNKERVAGSWIHSCNPLSARIIAHSGFDFVVIDMEHSPLDFGTLPAIISAFNDSDCIPIVRSPWNDMVAIKRILDCGAYGVHIPFVCNVEEAEAAVRYCKYPPAGVRGTAACTPAARYGFEKKDYFARANDEILTMVAIENLEGVANAEALTKIEGLDGIFIGPADLGASMGYLGTTSDEVQQAIRSVEKTVLKSDKFLGTIAPNAEAAKALYDRGYSFIIMMSDMVDLGITARKCVEDFHRLCL